MDVGDLKISSDVKIEVVFSLKIWVNPIAGLWVTLGSGLTSTSRLYSTLKVWVNPTIELQVTSRSGLTSKRGCYENLCVTRRC